MLGSDGPAVEPVELVLDANVAVALFVEAVALLAALLEAPVVVLDVSLPESVVLPAVLALAALDEVVVELAASVEGLSVVELTAADVPTAVGFTSPALVEVATCGVDAALLLAFALPFASRLWPPPQAPALKALARKAPNKSSMKVCSAPSTSVAAFWPEAAAPLAEASLTDEVLPVLVVLELPLVEAAAEAALVTLVALAGFELVVVPEVPLPEPLLEELAFNGVRPSWRKAWKNAFMKAKKPSAPPPAPCAQPLPSQFPSLSCVVPAAAEEPCTLLVVCVLAPCGWYHQLFEPIPEKFIAIPFPRRGGDAHLAWPKHTALQCVARATRSCPGQLALRRSVPSFKRHFWAVCNKT